MCMYVCASVLARIHAHNRKRHKVGGLAVAAFGIHMYTFTYMYTVAQKYRFISVCIVICVYE